MIMQVAAIAKQAIEDEQRAKLKEAEREMRAQADENWRRDPHQRPDALVMPRQLQRTC